MTDFDKARGLLRQFKGDSYLFGVGVLSRVGGMASGAGKKVVLVRDTFKGSDAFVKVITDSLSKAQVELTGKISGAR